MEHTAKHFALQLGSLISLYISLTSLLVLLFSLITILIPDAAAGMYEREAAMSSARFAIATLIVFFPTYLALTRVVNTIRRTGGSEYLTLTKWLIYLSLLVGGLVLLGNAVATLYTFLNGELTVRFVLKAGALCVVIGAAFVYYILDARGYWQTNVRQSIQFGIGALVLVSATIIVGFFHITPPQEVREMRIDDQQVQDLMQIQWKIAEVLQVGEPLPATLEEVFVNMPMPTAPEGRAPYQYKVTDKGFALCATFAYPTPENQYPSYPYYDDKAVIRNPDSWDHGDGEYCFERVVNEPTPTSAE